MKIKACQFDQLARHVGILILLFKVWKFDNLELEPDRFIRCFEIQKIHLRMIQHDSLDIWIGKLEN